MALDTQLNKIHQRFKSAGVEAYVCVDNVVLTFFGFLDAGVEATTFLRIRSRTPGSLSTITKMDELLVKLLLPGHTTTPAKTAFRRGIGVNVALREEAVVVGGPLNRTSVSRRMH